MSKIEYIKNGNKVLLLSKRILCCSSDNLELEYLFDEHARVVLEFEFVSDNSDKTYYNINQSSISFGLKYKIRLYNFNSSIGNGFRNPVKIGEYTSSGKKKIVYLMLFVSKLNDGYPIVDVNLYWEDYYEPTTK